VRVAAAAHLAAMSLQAALALGLLAGSAQAFSAHGWNARVVLALAVTQASLAVAHGPRRTGLWLTLFAVALVALEGAQIWLGTRGLAEAHVLNGLLIWGLSLAVLIKVASPGWAIAPPP
jgi:hypothetical protein